MTGPFPTNLGDRRLRATASPGLAALLFTAAVHLHLLCGFVCLHGHAELPPNDICRGLAPAR